jgi:hypothetical protein
LDARAGATGHSSFRVKARGRGIPPPTAAPGLDEDEKLLTLRAEQLPKLK